MFHWLKSTRSIIAVLTTFGLITGFLMGKLDAQYFMQVASIVFTAYFVKRDSKEDRSQIKKELAKASKSLLTNGNIAL